MKTPARQIHIALPVPNKKHIVMVLITVGFLMLGSYATVLAYSTKLKYDADKEFKNKNYTSALNKYQKAQQFWLPGRISFKLKDKDLYSKIEKARIMVKSEENYEKGIKAFINKDYKEAVIYLINVVETDKHFKETQNALKQIIETTQLTPTPNIYQGTFNQSPIKTQSKNAELTVFDWEKWNIEFANKVKEAKQNIQNNSNYVAPTPPQLSITVIVPTEDVRPTIIPEIESALSQLRDTLTNIKNSPIAMDVLIGKCSSAKDTWQTQYQSIYIQIRTNAYYEPQFRQILGICP